MGTWSRDVIIVSCGSKTTAARRTRILVRGVVDLCSDRRPRELHVVVGAWGPWPRNLEALALLGFAEDLRANVQLSNVELLHENECGAFAQMRMWQRKTNVAFAPRRVWSMWPRAVCFAYKI
jgi:hypothetical protein